MTRAVQPRLAMDGRPRVDLAHQRPGATGGERHAGNSEDARDGQRVSRHVLDGLVAHDRVTAMRSMFGLPCASSTAIASSWPGAQSRIIFVGTSSAQEFWARAFVQPMISKPGGALRTPPVD